MSLGIQMSICATLSGRADKHLGWIDQIPMLFWWFFCHHQGAFVSLNIMNTEKNTENTHVPTDRKDAILAAEKEGLWQQIKQHFQTTQTSLSLRLICEGNEVQKVGEVKSGVREASRLFNLQNSPQKAEELVASQENLFNRKCQQWEQVAKGAEARERANATGGSEGQAATSAANRRKLEAANNAVRGQISNSKQCFRRLRTALNRAVAHEVALNRPDDPGELVTESVANPESNLVVAESASAEDDHLQGIPEPGSVLSECLQGLIGEGLTLDYQSAPYLDPFANEGVLSREASWMDEPRYGFIVQWEERNNGELNFKFWIVPKDPVHVDELLADGPELYFHNQTKQEAIRLNFSLMTHDSKNGPVTKEVNQVLEHLESERFLNSDSQHKRLCYLVSSAPVGVEFEQAIQQSYLVEFV